MKNNLSYDFSIDKKNNAITIKKEFAADQELVWDAFTKREILDQWWAPKPWQAKTKSMDLRNGGHWLYAMVGPEGQEHWSRTSYTDVQPPQRFAGDDAFTDSEGNLNADMPQSRWEATFTSKDEKTLVELYITYSDTKQLDDTINMGFKEGITATLNSLDDLLASLQNKKISSY
jgi:uncharacterized protein YndB with AHSA1/START domain